MTDLFQHRLLFVTGKGGVGKSTVSAALGLLAARRGARAIVAEVSGRGDVPRLLGLNPAADGVEQNLREGLLSIQLDPQRAMEEYLADQLPVRRLADLLASSRTFTALAAVAPGLREVATVGKVWELAQLRRRTRGAAPYDIVIVDAPATGHGLGFLAAPRAFANLAQVGPIARHARTIDAALTDPGHTAVLAVCTPEEPAVTETIELRAALGERLGAELKGIIVNSLRPWRFAPRDAGRLRAALTQDLDAAARASVELALAEDTLVRGQHAQLRRLGDDVIARLPFLFRDALGIAELELLAHELEALA